MAQTVCPKCQTTLLRAFWEVHTHCPACGAEWSVNPEAQAHMALKVAVWAVLATVLSFAPAVGVVFGLVAAVMGVACWDLGKRRLGLVAILAGLLVGLAGQSCVIYWGVGQIGDRWCRSRLTTLSDSLYAYRALAHAYPKSLDAMADIRLPVPRECPVGGGAYFYMAPGSGKGGGKSAASQTASSQAATSAASRSAAKAKAPAMRTPGPEAPLRETESPAPAVVSTRQAGDASGRALRPGASANSQSASSQSAASKPANALPPELQGNSMTLVVAELEQGHRGSRFAITSDLVVRGYSPQQFAEMLTWPENEAFAASLEKAYKASTQPKKEKASSSSSKATSSRQTTQSASSPAIQPATASGPSTE